MTTPEKFFDAMKDMVKKGRPAWRQLALICDDNPSVDIEEVVTWLTDIADGNDI